MVWSVFSKLVWPLSAEQGRDRGRTWDDLAAIQDEGGSAQVTSGAAGGSLQVGAKHASGKKPQGLALWRLEEETTPRFRRDGEPRTETREAGGLTCGVCACVRVANAQR